jgi:hypothetical protein
MVLAAILPLCVVLVGCESRADRFDLSGSVTYGGKPVPAGYMVIKPDVSAGNKGPGATATINDGRYETRAGRGTIGGPHIVTIFGFDGQSVTMEGGTTNPMGKQICKVDVKADLPKENGTHDFVAVERRK